jgi:hypothetical protein
MGEGRIERKSQRRSGKERRAAERRKAERRKKPDTDVRNTRSGRDRRARAARSGKERRVLPDRRRSGETSVLSPGDRRRAREIPELVLTSRGSTFERVVMAVRRTWRVAPMQVRAGIAEGLIPLLEPVVDGSRTVDEDLLLQCEEVVAHWIARRR